MSDAAPALPAAADLSVEEDASTAAADSAVGVLCTTKAAAPDDAVTASAADLVATVAAADSGPAEATPTSAAASTEDSEQAEPATAEPEYELVDEEEPLKVLYCDVCGVPPEYCAYMDEFEKCKLWLAKYHADKVCKIYNAHASDQHRNLIIFTQLLRLSIFSCAHCY